MWVCREIEIGEACARAVHGIARRRGSCDGRGAEGVAERALEAQRRRLGGQAPSVHPRQEPLEELEGTRPHTRRCARQGCEHGVREEELAQRPKARDQPLLQIRSEIRE